MRAVWLEGTGGSYFELFAAAAGQEYNLVTSSSYGTPADTDGLLLGDMTTAIAPLEILSISFPPSRLLTLTWASNPGRLLTLTGRLYAIQRSPDLTAWSTIAANLPSAGSVTTWTAASAIPSGETRWFYRIREE